MRTLSTYFLRLSQRLGRKGIQGGTAGRWLSQQHTKAIACDLISEHWFIYFGMVGYRNIQKYMYIHAYIRLHLRKHVIYSWMCDLYVYRFRPSLSISGWLRLEEVTCSILYHPSQELHCESARVRHNYFSSNSCISQGIPTSPLPIDEVLLSPLLAMRNHFPSYHG